MLWFSVTTHDWMTGLKRLSMPPFKAPRLGCERGMRQRAARHGMLAGLAWQVSAVLLMID